MAPSRVAEFTSEHQQRFFRLMRRGFNMTPRCVAEQLWETLEKAYKEPQRHYHTAQHIIECLELLDSEWVHKAWLLGNHHNQSMRAELEAAIWWHDVVYHIPSGALSNEQASASYAFTSLVRNSGRTNSAHLVYLHILDTDHVASPIPTSMSSMLMCEIDMAILGSSPERFEQYSEQIRDEYSGVPLHDYLKGRRDFLQGVLDASSIFLTEAFRERFEEQARRNLNREIHRLNIFSREE